jgi:GNAT superfamily N-acetyltransferase
MNKSQIIALFDQDQRIDVEYPDMRREVTPDVVRLIRKSDIGEGVVIYSQLDETNTDDIIRQQVSYFESLGQDFEWTVYTHDQPPDLKERLSALGFTIEEVEAILVLDLEKASEKLWHPVHHHVQRISDPEGLAVVQSIEEEVWGEDYASLRNHLEDALRNYPGQMSVYVAFKEEQPASTAWIYFPQHSQFAGLWGGSTLREFRKQGLYTALLAVRAQEAKARQVRYLRVDASPMSRPILERYGFKLIDYSYPCKWKHKS